MSDFKELRAELDVLNRSHSAAAKLAALRDADARRLREENELLRAAIADCGPVAMNACHERERIRALLAEACDALDVEGLVVLADELRRRGGVER